MIGTQATRTSSGPAVKRTAPTGRTHDRNRNDQNFKLTLAKKEPSTHGHYGGISPVLVFSINDDETEAMVYDAFIKETYDKPIEAKIVVANTKRYTLKWSVAVKRIRMGSRCRGSTIGLHI
ncbi:hypothetical protein [Profundibacter sp.]|uniref:hypothetical protein n=1 Tax=Profundibacter sp. TaxID=3101071 RepID=UPI003D0F3BF0